MNFFSNVSGKFLTTSNMVLLFIVIFTIFIIPFFPIEWHRVLFSICFTLIFLLSAFALSKYRSRIIYFAIAVIVINLFSSLLNLYIFNTVSYLIMVLFFVLMVILLILQIVRAKNITFQVIIASIIGYLMLGLSFSVLIGFVYEIDSSAYSFQHIVERMDTTFFITSNYIYYGFVTLTTLGYGDIIPLTPETKSLAIFISITGQMYIAIVIATLVSKYLKQKSSSKDK